MGFFSRLGGKLSSGVRSAARLGNKVLSSVSRVGNTIAHGAEKALNVVDRIPVVGQVLAPVSGVVRSGIGLVKDVVSASDSARDLLKQGEAVLDSGDLSQVGGLVKSAKSKLEKGGKLKSDAKALLGDVKQLKSGLNKDSAKAVGRQAIQLAKAEGQKRMGM